MGDHYAGCPVSDPSNVLAWNGVWFVQDVENLLISNVEQSKELPDWNVLFHQTCCQRVGSEHLGDPLGYL